MAATYLKTKHTYFINMENEFFHGVKVMNVVWKALEMGDTAGLRVGVWVTKPPASKTDEL